MSGAPPAQAAIKGRIPEGTSPPAVFDGTPQLAPRNPHQLQQASPGPRLAPRPGTDPLPQAPSEAWSITTPGPMVEDRVTRFM